MRLLNKIILISINFTIFGPANGSTDENVEMRGISRHSNQILVGYSQSAPISKTSKNLKPGKATTQFEYVSFLPNNWVLTFGGGYQILRGLISNEPLAILRIYQKSQKVIRIYHPVYLSTGFEISYLMFEKGANNLPELRINRDSEIGLGITNSLLWRFSEASSLSIVTNLWGGTATGELKAAQLALMIGTSI